MPRLPTSRLLLIPALVPLLGACAMDLPDARVIISHRVLAIRTEVIQTFDPNPELDADRPKAEALPFDTVELRPFIVDPEGEVDPDSLDVVWLACELSPGQGLFACVSDALPTTLDDIPDCPVPNFMDLGEELPEPPSPCLIAREGTPEFTVPLSPNVFVGGSVELTMIAGVPEGTSTDACTSALLSGAYDVPDDCLFAVQRLNVGPLERLAAFAANLGFEIPGLEAPDEDELPEPDRHPRISEIRVGVINEDGEQVGNAVTISNGEVFTAPRESILQIEVDSPEEDLQTFLIPVNNGESFDERSEAYDGQWYRTWGQLLSGTSDDPMSYNQWTLTQGEQDETEAPPEGRARIYYTVRDGRQGVNWFWFEVEVTEPEPELP